MLPFCSTWDQSTFWSGSCCSVFCCLCCGLCTFVFLLFFRFWCCQFVFDLRVWMFLYFFRLSSIDFTMWHKYYSALVIKWNRGCQFQNPNSLLNLKKKTHVHQYEQILDRTVTKINNSVFYNIVSPYYFTRFSNEPGIS